MHSKLSLALVAAFVFLAPAARAADAAPDPSAAAREKRMEEALADARAHPPSAGQRTEDATAHDTHHASHTAHADAHHAGETMKEDAHKTGQAVSQGAHKAGHAVGHAASEAGTAVEHEAHKASAAMH
jgi:hypothetical protein